MQLARLLFLGGTLAVALLAEAALTGACSTSSTSTTPPGHDGGHDAGAGPAKDAGRDVHHVIDAGSREDALVAACTESANVQCQVLSQCNLPLLLSQYGTLAGCLEGLAKECEAKATAPSSGVTAAQIASCATGTAKQSCASYLNAERADGCAPLTGSLGADASCWTGEECQTGYCEVTLGSFCGACAASPAVGTPCGSLFDCGPGQVCSAGVCAVYASVTGLPCSETSPCGANLTCVFTPGTGTGTCQAAGTVVGLACNSRPEAGPGCGAGLHCLNQACVAGIGCAAKTCEAGTSCETLDGGAHECVPRAADGQPCNTLSGPLCFVPSRCLGTTVPTDGGLAVIGTCNPVGHGSCP